MRFHSSHWGTFLAEDRGGDVHVRPFDGDPNPSEILKNIPSSVRHQMRVRTPAVRRGWLRDGPGRDARRGQDGFVSVSWNSVLDLVARELVRVKESYGLEAIFGGSQGWSSAGRFHHAQSQLHRFLNLCLGGYVRSINNYSAGASEVIFPHIFGHAMMDLMRANVTWEQVATTTEVVIAFGGMAPKNSQVAPGGISSHIERASIKSAAERGCRFISISPLRSDLPSELNGEWIQIEPGTDTALMLAIMYHLVIGDRFDKTFVDKYCSGWEPLRDYLMGVSDGRPKDAGWAESICKIPAERIVGLTHRLHGKRALVVVAHSLQRSEHGEQPVWAGAALASLLGQIGLPGGGYSYALGTMGLHGRRRNAVPVPALPQGTNGVTSYIPVARISDMLLNPGESYQYNGRTLEYPNIRLVYWAGGNPMHHHQDLKRLTKAFQTLETFIVNENSWTATARLADIVLPCTMTLEREDIASTPTDPLLTAMRAVLPPYGEARDEYDIFSDLAERLGRREVFTEGRTSREWLSHLYGLTKEGLQQIGVEAPTFEEFWESGQVRLPQRPDDGGLLRSFREDPEKFSLPTPSGRIELSSSVIEGFHYESCPKHPTWLPPSLAPDASYPLWLVTNQPDRRLHSQLDFGDFSLAGKKDGREVCRMHVAAACERGIQDGDIVRIYNAIGACLSVVELTEDIRPNVVRLPTGAWYTPWVDANGETICIHGNPNILTRDVGTSSLAQGCSGHLVPVQVERYSGRPPRVDIFDEITFGEA